LQNGDLIFQDLDCALCEAIESVTDGYNDYNFSHVGIVKRQEGSIWVGEAISAGLHWTPLEEFLERATRNKTPQVLVMRLKKQHQKRIPAALKFIDSKIGAPYDSVYTYGDDSYYCSELLYDAFAKTGPSLFQLQPMTFKAADSDHFHPAWETYFQALHHPIPEGKPGLNPGGMSTSPHLKPIFVMGLD
jgi:uncharacterized protein YycO